MRVVYADRMDLPPVYSLKARWVFPVCRPPIASGIVTIKDDRIVAVGRGPVEGPVQDLGDVAILPGFVNAHTHLEFSDLAAPLGSQGMSFPDWIRKVIAYKRRTAGKRGTAIQVGLAECGRHGTTTLGEIATWPWWTEPSRQPLDITIFLELIGLDAARIEALTAQAEQHLSDMPPSSFSRFRPGLSPHSPYTVNANLLRYTARLAAASHAPLAMHLAESREELELLSSGSGPLVELLEELGAWAPSAIPRGTRPLDYLHLLAESPCSLVIHGNYLDASERAFIAAQSDGMSIIYCPRTHAYFGHAPYPLEALLASGATVALGTDSRASNPDLSLLEEMRFVARAYPAVPRSAVLELGTLAGAKALGLDAEVGSLLPGKRADFAIVPIGERSLPDPHDLFFDSQHLPTAVYIRGALAS